MTNSIAQTLPNRVNDGIGDLTRGATAAVGADDGLWDVHHTVPYIACPTGGGRFYANTGVFSAVGAGASTIEARRLSPATAAPAGVAYDLALFAGGRFYATATATAMGFYLSTAAGATSPKSVTTPQPWDKHGLRWSIDWFHNSTGPEESAGVAKPRLTVESCAEPTFTTWVTHGTADWTVEVSVPDAPSIGSLQAGGLAATGNPNNETLSWTVANDNVDVVRVDPGKDWTAGTQWTDPLSGASIRRIGTAGGGHKARIVSKNAMQLDGSGVVTLPSEATPVVQKDSGGFSVALVCAVHPGDAAWRYLLGGQSGNNGLRLGLYPAGHANEGRIYAQMRAGGVTTGVTAVLTNAGIDHTDSDEFVVVMVVDGDDQSMSVVTNRMPAPATVALNQALGVAAHVPPVIGGITSTSGSLNGDLRVPVTWQYALSAAEVQILIDGYQNGDI